MNFKGSRLFTYVLIIVMVLAPLRIVFAAHCNMQQPDTMQAVPTSSAHITMHHNMTAAGHDMSAMLQAADLQQPMKKHDCCADHNNRCTGDCDLGMSVSVILQQTSYSPVYLSSIQPLFVAFSILSRELTPPSRPPAVLHS